ncbi:membrane associated protein [Cryptosporidium canis]|uniref:Membrane associated protein n=1 Tax=Cryptosporidium canis TaxID=195482 RepID=A0ABQ8P7R3_9CRYT|nr:membrane associated protein [Cryptosporidium canis]
MRSPKRKFSTVWKVLLGNVFTIILCLSNVYSTWNLEWLQSQIPFKSSSASISRSEKLKFSEIHGKIKSFVDFNGDKFTDVVLFNEKEKKIQILLWNNTQGDFYDGPTVEFDGEIASLIPADWTGSGNIEIMATFYLEHKTYGFRQNKIGLILFSHVPESMKLEKVWVSNDLNFSVVDPLAIDINGDGMLDLLGESGNGRRFIWVNTNGGLSHDREPSIDSTLVSNVDFKIYEWGAEISHWVDLESSNFSYGRIVENHSSAFVDMDGDCRSDLVLEVYYEELDGRFNGVSSQIRKGLEIWTNEIVGEAAIFKRYFHRHRDDNKLGLTLLPTGALSISYSDFNRDGTTDIIVPVCNLGSFGCESKSRLVFIPNIHEYKDCTSTNQFGFSIYKSNIKEHSSEFTVKCRSPSMYCSASPFKIHSFTEEDNQLIFQEPEVHDGKKNTVGFFSSLFGDKKSDDHSVGSFFDDFTVSIISDKNVYIDGVSYNTNDPANSGRHADNLQLNTMANHVASLFSFFPRNKDVGESIMQWAINENNQAEISVGDYNLDGYPDILAVLKLGNGTRQTKLIENLPIEKSVVINSTNEHQSQPNLDSYGANINSSSIEGFIGERKIIEKVLKTFKSSIQWLSSFFLNSGVVVNGDPTFRRFAISSYVKPFTDFSVDYASFYDFFDDGNLDIISFSYPEKNGGSKVSLSIASSDNPNLFVKVSVLKFPIISKSIGDSKRIGTTYLGATVKIRMTGLVGDDILMTATQISHSNGRALQMPYVLFGLGKTNNYIEELYVGTNYINRRLLSGRNSILEYKQLLSDGVSKWSDKSSQFTYSNIWTGIIPNTQIIAQVHPVDAPKSWTLVLSVSPQKTVKGVIIVCILALVIIGIIIIVLDRRERAEDFKEHQGFKNNFISA